MTKTAHDLKLEVKSPLPLHLHWFRRFLKDRWKNVFGIKCPCCGRDMDFRNKGAKNYATIDHIKARALGGTNDAINIQIIRRDCNNKKSKREGFLAKREADIWIPQLA